MTEIWKANIKVGTRIITNIPIKKLPLFIHLSQEYFKGYVEQQFTVTEWTGMNKRKSTGFPEITIEYISFLGYANNEPLTF